MGDSSPAHHTTSSGFSRAESAGGSSDVTAGLGFHRPPSLLNEVSPSFSSSTVEKSVIANPFRGSLPMGCTSATDGQGQAVGGVWPRSQRHINLLELETVQLVLTHFAPRLRGRDVLIRSDNRATVAHKSPGRSPVSCTPRSGDETVVVGTQTLAFSVSGTRTRQTECGGRLDVARGPRDDDWRLNPEIVSLIWERFGEARADLFAARENAQCRLWFLCGRRTVLPWGRTRLRITVGPRVSFTLFPTVMPGTTAGAGKSGSFNGDCSRPGSSGGAMVSGNDSIVGCGAVATSPSGTLYPRLWELSSAGPVISGPLKVWLLERDRLTKRGLSADVIRTIQSARASSTSTLYSNRWSMFVRWCETNTMDPVCCPVEQILSFLQYLLDKRRSASTIKGYAAAISACHEGFRNKTVFSHSLVKRFLTGTRRLRPVARASVPQWDLSTVLNALCAPPFEPLSQISLRLLSLKTALLLALCSTNV
ncbi:hypothetical protein DPEC_G00109300 [Dallia pectoralis]|uniref:Uncharacterized protein n=1 Tax=Dallia pectoralis TaxID=75939 RepID=A0ACC2GSV3_DALPE|nr:hypothetical protein DPEC_G00109300 [Dallia pectoralis]